MQGNAVQSLIVCAWKAMQTVVDQINLLLLNSNQNYSLPFAENLETLFAPFPIGVGIIIYCMYT